jgi:hypothetical protein
MLCRFIRFSETDRVFVREMPAPVVFWIVPPLLAAAVPVTLRPPLLPVLLSTIPLVGPVPGVPAEMLRNFRPDAPIVVLATLSAVPVELVSVLAVSDALTVPPPVALKAVVPPELSDSVPVKESVEPVLLVRSTPLPAVVVTVPA